MERFYAGLSDELSPWVKQAAWLQTTPDGKHQSRMATMVEAKEPLPPSPPNPAPYLTDWLFEIGPMTAGNVIGWQDLTCWQRITGIELQPWEARILRRLSGEYALECLAARKPDRIMPYLGDRDEIEARRAAVAAKAAAMFA